MATGGQLLKPWLALLKKNGLRSLLMNSLISWRLNRHIRSFTEHLGSLAKSIEYIPDHFWFSSGDDAAPCIIVSSPLYGRSTANLLLQPLPFGVTSDFYPDYQADERVAVYAMLGEFQPIGSGLTHKERVE